MTLTATFPILIQRFLVPFLLAYAILCGPVMSAEVTTAGLTQTEVKIQELSRKALAATVSLIPRGRTRRPGTGSGVIVSEDGLILTAAHVAMEMNEEVTVIFADGKRAAGKVLGMDYTRDSGMIQITDRKKKYPFVELGDSKGLIENDWCVALGHAGGYQPDRSAPVRLGRVISNNSKKFMRTDSALIGGDSGGPLFDIDGKLIGIHSNIGMSLSQNNHVPIATFLENWDRLKAGDRFGGDDVGALLSNPDRPMIGAVLVDAPDQSGAIVAEIVPKSPAERAGLKKGDIVVKAGQEEISNSDSLIAAIRKHKAGQTISVTVDSKGKEKSLSIKLASARKLGARSRGPRQQLPPRSKPRSPEEQEALQKDFNRKMRESLDEGSLKLTESDFEEFRNTAEFMKLMKNFQKTLPPDEIEKLTKVIQPPQPIPVRPGTYDPDKPIPVGEDFFRSVLDAFRPSAAKASAATHLVFRGQEWKSLCTVVHEDGYALTKASEIETANNQKLNVLLGKGKLVPARVIKKFPEHDLALLRLENTSGLAAVRWDASRSLPLGSILSAPGPGPDPVAIGLVSVQPRSLRGDNKGFLGIGTSDHEKGVAVTMVLEKASAGRAGVRKNDVIYQIDDTVCDTPEKLIKKISGKKPGTKVVLHLFRKGVKLSLNVTLGNRKDLEENMADPSGRMNKMGTEVSERSSGFPNVLQTDLPILPQQCGGPLVDLQGNVVGINIARAGRIKTYAIPADEVGKLLKPELAKISRKKKRAVQ